MKSSKKDSRPMHPASDSLFIALKTAFTEAVSGEDKSVAFLRAELHPQLNSAFAKHRLFCTQTFKPSHDLLKHAQFSLAPHLEDYPPMDVVIYLATRNREENKYKLAQSFNLLKDGGKLITAQHNNLGAKHLEKDLKALVSDIQVFSKKHSRVIMAQKSTNLCPKTMTQYLTYGTPTQIKNTPLSTMPGLFSWKKPDAGSQMLADAFDPKYLQGKGADLGAGWGFLAYHALKQSANISEMHLFEAEKRALDMAAQNLSKFTNAAFHWADVAGDPLNNLFDFILCNPPQHDVTRHAHDLPLAFINKAAHALKPRGTLWLVTNNHVPAETHMEGLFRRVEELNKDKQYKIFRAMK